MVWEDEVKSGRLNPPACQAGGREFKSRRSRQILRKG